MRALGAFRGMQSWRSAAARASRSWRSSSLLRAWGGAGLIAAIGSWAAIGAASGMLAPGAQFPAWRLRDHTGAERASTDFAGKSYLLWFYPKAQTPGCIAEGRGLRDVHAELEAAGVSVVGVSADEPAANAKFVEAERFPFPLLSDANLELAASVGAADHPGAAAARRVSYLVGPDGKVVKAYPAVDPPAHAREVLDDLEAAAPAARSAHPPGSADGASP